MTIIYIKNLSLKKYFNNLSTEYWSYLRKYVIDNKSVIEKFEKVN